MEKLHEITCPTCQKRQKVKIKTAQRNIKYVECGSKKCRSVFSGLYLQDLLEDTISKSLAVA
jgi:hypothetical protein